MTKFVTSVTPLQLIKLQLKWFGPMNPQVMFPERLKDIWLLCTLTVMFCDKSLSSNLYCVKSNGPCTVEIYDVLIYLYLP